MPSDIFPSPKRARLDQVEEASLSVSSKSETFSPAEPIPISVKNDYCRKWLMENSHKDDSQIVEKLTGSTREQEIQDNVVCEDSANFSVSFDLRLLVGDTQGHEVYNDTASVESEVLPLPDYILMEQSQDFGETQYPDAPQRENENENPEAVAETQWPFDHINEDNYYGKVSELERASSFEINSQMPDAEPILSSAFVTSLKMRSKVASASQLCSLIPTRNKNIDTLLGGGIRLGTITELVGMHHTGKTTFCLQLALHVVMPSAVGGMDGEAIFITRKKLEQKRFNDMSYEIIDLCSKTIVDQEWTDKLYSPNCYAKKIQIIQYSDLSEISGIVYKIKQRIISNDSIKLIVVEDLEEDDNPDNNPIFSCIIKELKNMLKVLHLQNNPLAIIVTHFMAIDEQKQNRLYYMPKICQAHTMLANRILYLSKIEDDDSGISCFSGARLEVVGTDFSKYSGVDFIVRVVGGLSDE